MKVIVFSLLILAGNTFAWRAPALDEPELKRPIIFHDVDQAFKRGPWKTLNRKVLEGSWLMVFKGKEGQPVDHRPAGFSMEVRNPRTGYTERVWSYLRIKFKENELASNSYFTLNTAYWNKFDTSLATKVFTFLRTSFSHIAEVSEETGLIQYGLRGRLTDKGMLIIHHQATNLPGAQPGYYGFKKVE